MFISDSPYLSSIQSACTRLTDLVRNNGLFQRQLKHAENYKGSAATYVSTGPRSACRCQVSAMPDRVPLKHTVRRPWNLLHRRPTVPVWAWAAQRSHSVIGWSPSRVWYRYDNSSVAAVRFAWAGQITSTAGRSSHGWVGACIREESGFDKGVVEMGEALYEYQVIRLEPDKTLNGD